MQLKVIQNIYVLEDEILEHRLAGLVQEDGSTGQTSTQAEKSRFDDSTTPRPIQTNASNDQPSSDSSKVHDVKDVKDTEEVSTKISGSTHSRTADSTEIDPKLINIYKKAKTLSSEEDVGILVSYYDLDGGEELYYATHHIHLSSDAVYILVFDMSEMAKENEQNKRLRKYRVFHNIYYTFERETH